MVDVWCKSYRRAPKAITLDIDDTADTVHGHQQLSMFNAHYEERCFLPIHVYDADTGHCVPTTCAREDAIAQGGGERRPALLVRRIRLHWPNTRITIRGDSHYGRREAMDWCEQNRVHYIFGLSTNAVLAAQVFAKTDDVCVRRATGTWMWCATTPETRYAAKLAASPAASWHGSRRRGKVSMFATSLPISPMGIAAWLYDGL